MMHDTLLTFSVEVLLNEGAGRFFEFDPDTAHLVRAPVTLTVRAATARQACEAALALGNGMPGGDQPDGAGQVKAWEHARLRSISVGDIVVVHTPDGPAPFAGKDFGWAALSGVPRTHTDTESPAAG